MEKKIKYFLGFGVLIYLLTLIIQSLVIGTCKGGLGCLFFVVLFALPGLILQDVTNISLTAVKIINVLFYFIIGGIIGLLIANKNKK